MMSKKREPRPLRVTLDVTDELRDHIFLVGQLLVRLQGLEFVLRSTIVNVGSVVGTNGARLGPGRGGAVRWGPPHASVRQPGRP